MRQAIAADTQFQSIFAESASLFVPKGYPLTACTALSQTKAELDAVLPTVIELWKNAAGFLAQTDQ